MKKIIAAFLVALLTLSSISVMAAKSPIAQDLHKVTVNGQTIDKDGATIDVDGGSITASTGVAKNGEKVKLKATEAKGMKFTKWSISGKYTIVSGNLTSKSITIIPDGDVDVKAAFADKRNDGNGDGEETTKPDSTQQPVIQTPDDSSTSPKTGMNDVAPVVAVLLLAVSALALSTKRKEEQ